MEVFQYDDQRSGRRLGDHQRRVNALCKAGRISGAYKEGRQWFIPDSSQKPMDKRGHRSVVRPAVSSARKPLPIGVSDYRDACKNYYYVDKTLMIKEFLDERPKVSLFTRPRRFGKTLNMDMLRTFFEKTTEDTSVYFRDKKIWSCGGSYLAHHRKYPVIFLSFKDVKYTSWEETYQTLQKLIAQEFRRHDDWHPAPHLVITKKRNIPFLQQKPLTKWNIKCPCGH